MGWKDAICLEEDRPGDDCLVALWSWIELIMRARGPLMTSYLMFVAGSRWYAESLNASKTWCLFLEICECDDKKRLSCRGFCVYISVLGYARCHCCSRCI